MARRRPVDIGTKFETAVCRYLRERLGDGRIERRVKHGNRDMGDIFGIRAHGAAGIAECKCHEVVTASRVAEWRRQTEVERANADADFALLVVRRKGCNYEDHTARLFGRHDVHVTMRDLLTISGVTWGKALFPAALDRWVTLPLGECCDLIEGVQDDS